MSKTGSIDDDFPKTVFDVRYFREPKGFLNLGIHVDYRRKNFQLFVGRWHLSVGWQYDEVCPCPYWTSLIAYTDDE